MPGISRAHATLLAVAIGGVSFSAILARWAQSEAVPSLVIAFYRLLFATLMLLPFAARSMLRERPHLPPREVAAMAGVGFLLAAHFATWITSLEYTSVASSVVIVATESLWVPLGTAFLLRERVSWRMWVGILVAFSGSALLVLGDSGETRFGGKALLGDFLAFAGALAASLYFLAGRRLRQRHSLLTYATLTYAFAALFLLGMALAQGSPLYPYSRHAFGILLLFAFFPMILGHTLINYLLRWVSPPLISTAILGEPVVSSLMAVILLAEPIRGLVLWGGLIILAGILIAVVPSRSRNRIPVTDLTDVP